VEQRAADDLSGEREGIGEFGAPTEDGFMIHLH
jgi:hypothetical protein